MKKNIRVCNYNKTFLKQHLGEIRTTTDFTTEQAAKVLDINVRQAFKLMSEIRSKQKRSVISLTNCPICCGARGSELSVEVTDEYITTRCKFCSATCRVSAHFWSVSRDKKIMSCSTPVRFSKLPKDKAVKRRRLLFTAEEHAKRFKSSSKIKDKEAAVVDAASTSCVLVDDSDSDTPSQKHDRFSYYNT